MFFVTEDWYFCSHRLPIARAAKKEGYEIVVVTRVQKHGSVIKNEMFRLLPISLSRKSKNPLRELLSLLEITNIYLNEKPDIVHHIALKPVLYGSIAALFVRKIQVVNAMAGLGFVFASKRIIASILRPMVKLAFRLVLSRSTSHTIVQNPDDKKLLLEEVGVPERQMTLIRGSGVDTSIFTVTPEPAGIVTIVLVSRMLWDKGVGEFVEASRLLRRKHFDVSIRTVLIGKPDPENPASISEEQLHTWQSEGCIEWWGHQEDIPTVWSQSHIAVLPSSYGEGVPKSLIEAAACGRPIVTTDMPGCREIVQHNKNGFLVPVKDARALADAICQLIENPELRRQMGQAGRKLVEDKFTESIVVSQTLKLYQSMLRQ